MFVFARTDVSCHFKNKPTMKYLVLLFIIFFYHSPSFGQEHKGYKEWLEEAKTDFRMIPMYGHQKKSEQHIKADEELIQSILEQDKTAKAGSEHLIKVGFDYLYKRQLRTAMYRFNQAWLLDSTNANVFWGFGGVYFYLRAYDQALKMFHNGLQIDSLNTNLITDIGGTYLSMFDEDQSNKENLSRAIFYLNKSYNLNPKYSSTVYKLIICSLFSEDCEKAKRYFLECDNLKNNQITETFRAQVYAKCK